MEINLFFKKILEFTIPWFLTSGVKILAILIGVFITIKIAKIFIEKLVRKAVVGSRHSSAEAEKKREDTLIKVFSGTFKVLIWIAAFLMILSEFGMDIGPLLAGAGIAGLAFGFGGQYLIRDIISGLFIIMENQYRVGDVVCFNETCGVVEDMNLRLTKLRDLDGIVHHIPNGEIKKASNLSKEFARVNLNVGVSYDSKLEHVIEVINRVGMNLASDPAWKNKIIKAPEFLRVDNFGDSSIDVKILGEVKPLEQWAVTGELRKRLKVEFDKEGIEIPFPQRVIYQRKSPDLS